MPELCDCALCRAACSPIYTPNPCNDENVKFFAYCWEAPGPGMTSCHPRPHRMLVSWDPRYSFHPCCPASKAKVKALALAAIDRLNREQNTVVGGPYWEYTLGDDWDKGEHWRPNAFS
jgi:hypothetical protein